MDEFSYQGHEFILRDIIEEFLEVDIHDICISILEVFKQFYDCLLGSSSRSKPIAMLTEMRLDYWRQYLYDCLGFALHHSALVSLPFALVEDGISDFGFLP